MAQRRSLMATSPGTSRSSTRSARRSLNAAKARREKIKTDIKNTQTEIKTLNHQLHPKGKHAKPPTGATRKHLIGKLDAATKRLGGYEAARRRGGRDQRHREPDGQPQHRLGHGPRRRLPEVHVRPLRPDLKRRLGHRGRPRAAADALQGPVTDNRILGMGSSAQDLVNALPGSLKNWYGDIGGTLGSMNTFGSDFFTAPTPATPDGPTIDPFTLELQRLTSQRDLIGQLQAPLIAVYPYGGSFAAGGTVPGPPGDAGDDHRARRRAGRSRSTTSAAAGTRSISTATRAPSRCSKPSDREGQRQVEPRCRLGALTVACASAR